MKTRRIRPAKLDLRLGRSPLPPPPGMLYVSQANYALVPMFRKSGVRYLYSDSATSCIIFIAMGMNTLGQPVAALAHLDSPACIRTYFETVLDVNYRGSVLIYAQGANPPGDKSSEENAAALRECLDRRRMVASAWTPDVRHLGLGEGDPQIKDRGDYGVSIAPQVPVVSAQPFNLELLDRDPTGGVQTLFCIMRRQMDPPIQLRDEQTPFSSSLVAQLVRMAASYRKDPKDPMTAFTYIIDLTGEEVCNTWSTTPQYEAAWFADELKQSCCFTRVYLARLKPSRLAIARRSGSGTGRRSRTHRSLGA